MEVHRVLGYGLNEKPYENALVTEFRLQEITCLQQPLYTVNYKGVEVGEYRPDIIAFGRIVVDTKTIEQIGRHELGQMLNYLKVTGLPLGLIINFAKPSLEFRRVILSRSGFRTAD